MKPENTPETTASKPAVTSGGFRGKLTRRRNKALFIGAIAVVILLVFGGGYGFYKQLHPTVVKPHYDTSGLPADYSLMTLPQLQLALQAYTNVTLDQLKSQDIQATMFDNYSQAYVAAQVLNNSVVDLQPKALQAYKIAAAKAGSHEASYTFYINYAYECMDNKDFTSAVAQLNNAKKAVDSDKTLDSAGKLDMKAQIDTLIKTWKN